MSDTGLAVTSLAAVEAVEAIEAVEDQRPSTARNLAVLLATQIITWSLNAVVIVVQPRYLGPVGLGQLRLAASLWTIASVVVMFGTATLLTLEMARDRKRGARALRPVVRLRLLLSIVATGVILAFTLAAGYDRGTIVVVAISALAVVITLVADVARSALYGLHLVPATARADIVAKVLIVAVVAAVVVFSGDARAFALFGAIPAAVGGIMMWKALRRAVGTVAAGDAPAMRSLVRQGSPYLLGDATRIVYHQLDIVVLSLLASTQEVGWYGVADTLFGSLFFIPTILMTALFPVFARMHEREPAQLGTMLRRSFRGLLLLSVPVGVGTVVVAEPVSVLLFGESFRPSGAVLAIFGIVLMLEFENILLGQYALAIGRHRYFNIVMMVATVASIPLDLVLVPWAHRTYGNGGIGAGLAFIVTELMILGSHVVILAPGLVDRATVVRLVKVTIAAAALFAVAWPLRFDFLLLPIAAGAVAYVLTLVALRVLDGDERAAVRGGVARLTSRVRRPA